MTGRSRGFAFVPFSDPSSVDRTLAEAVHEVDGKSINVAKAEENRESVTRAPGNRFFGISNNRTFGEGGVNSTFGNRSYGNGAFGSRKNNDSKEEDH